MALRIKKAISEALDAARHGEQVDLSALTIPRLGGGHVVKGPDDKGSMIRRFFLSDKSVDRNNDTIDPEGWNLKEFKKNGVVLWAHNSWEPPVAEPKGVKVEGEEKNLKLFGSARFLETYDFSQLLLNLIDEGALKNVSVGFIPEEWAYNEERGGIDFTKQRLVEWSIVPIGSHPGAMVQLAKEKGMDLNPMLDWSRKWLDNDPQVGKAIADDVEVAAICKALEPFAHTIDPGAAPQTVKNAQEPAAEPATEPEGKTVVVEPKGDQDNDDGTPATASPVERAFELLEQAAALIADDDSFDEETTQRAVGALQSVGDILAPPPEPAIDKGAVRELIKEAVADLIKERPNAGVSREEATALVRDALGAMTKEILRDTGRLPA